jgi:hypothetical protein
MSTAALTVAIHVSFRPFEMCAILQFFWQRRLHAPFHQKSLYAEQN